MRAFKRSALQVAMVLALLAASFLLPGTAFGAKGTTTPKTVGQMLGTYQDWWGESNTGDYVYSSLWQWNIRGSHSGVPASGVLTHTITRRGPEGTAEAVLASSYNAVAVVKTAPNTLEVTFDRNVEVPGSDPSWSSNRMQFVDNGTSGDQILEWCWRCSYERDVWHQLSSTGHLKVW